MAFRKVIVPPSETSSLLIVIAHKALFFIASNMSKFVSEEDILQRSLIAFFHLEKTSAKSYRLLIEAYGKHGLI